MSPVDGLLYGVIGIPIIFIVVVGIGNLIGQSLGWLPPPVTVETLELRVAQLEAANKRIADGARAIRRRLRE